MNARGAGDILHGGDQRRRGMIRAHALARTPRSQPPDKINVISRIDPILGRHHVHSTQDSRKMPGRILELPEKRASVSIKNRLPSPGNEPIFNVGKKNTSHHNTTKHYENPRTLSDPPSGHFTSPPRGKPPGFGFGYLLEQNLWKQRLVVRVELECRSSGRGGQGDHSK